MGLGYVLTLPSPKGRDLLITLETPGQRDAVIVRVPIVLRHDERPVLHPITQFFFVATGIGTFTMARMIDVATDAVPHRAADQDV